MNENINLCELLKGREGEVFYSPLLGNVRLVEVNDDEMDNGSPIKVHCVDLPYNAADDLFTEDGRYWRINDTECMLFPSKSQRDWRMWKQSIETQHSMTLIKSALAYFKIQQLVDTSYGGIPTTEDRVNCTLFMVDYCPKYEEIDGVSEFYVRIASDCYGNILFHSSEQAEDFISHSENIQLLRDYYMI